MNDDSAKDSAQRIVAETLRIKARILTRLDDGDLEKTVVDALAECLEVRARESLRKVEDEQSARNYIKTLRHFGSTLIEHAEQHSVLEDPYSDAKLRRIAESSIDYIRRKAAMSAAQQEQFLRDAVARIREGVRARSGNWQTWKAEIVLKIEIRFEAVYLHWEAEAIDRVRDRGASAPVSTDVAGKTAVQPVPADSRGEVEGQRATSWQDIEISFLSDERVQVRDGARTQTYNYTELGFVDQRDGKPSRAWIALREIAEHKGTLSGTKSTTEAWKLTEKRVQEIRKLLRAKFGLLGDPLPLVSGTAYQAVFKVQCAPSYEF